MSAPTRFQTGVREPKNTEAIPFASVRVRAGEHEPVPAFPPVDYLADLADWQVLGNDRAGDCLAVWWANSRRLTTRRLATEDYPTQEQVWELYRTQNPLFDPADPTSFGGPNDAGMEPQTLLEYLVREGGPDGVRALAFVKADQTDLAEVKALVSILGSVLLIVSMTEAQQLQFEQGGPWDFDGTSPADGLHAILVGGHLDMETGDLALVTWGSRIELTDAFFRNATVQVWGMVYPEHLGSREFQDGVDVDALAAEYTRVTDDPFPGDMPTPQPDPRPGPAPGAPVITAPGDGATVDTTQAVVGTGQAGCTVTVYDSGVSLGDALVGSDNAWTLSTDWGVDPLDDQWVLTAKQIDPDGQESAESAPVTVTLREPGPTPAPEPGPDDDPDEAFAHHLARYLTDDPVNWDVQNDHRIRIQRWLDARADLVLPGSAADRRRTQERVAAEAAADAAARVGADRLHLADQQAQADNERDSFPQHVPGEDRLAASADRARQMLEATQEAQRDAAARAALPDEVTARIAEEDKDKITLPEVEHGEDYPAPGGE